MSPLSKWLIGALFSLTLMFSGWAFTNTSERVAHNEYRTVEQGQRLASLEAQRVAEEERLKRIEQLLQWIVDQMWAERQRRAK